MELFKTSYVSKLNGVKSVFLKAKEDAQALIQAIQADIDAKTEQIVSIQSDIANIKQTQEETQSFLDNIGKIV